MRPFGPVLPGRQQRKELSHQGSHALGATLGTGDEQAAFQERYGNDPKARMVIQGKGKKSTANNRQETAASAGPVFGREAAQ